MSRPAPRLDVLCAVALSLLTILSRLPYRARMLYNWDAVQFALALREYDVAKHQPHPPGYILYVALGRLVNAWLDDPTAAYVFLAVLFSGLTTFVVYYLALAIYDRTTALAAATLLAREPALLVLRLGRAYLRRRGPRGLGGRLLCPPGPSPERDG